jgi:hypothetical protein
MKKWLNDLYAIILKNGYNFGGGGGTGAGFHSSIYRGKYLGNTYTDEQKEAIANGSFDGLFIGDYWTINGVNWRIADFDYYYNIGDTNFTKHHVVIVSDTCLYNAQMNSENVTTGAYTGSEMYTTNLDNARTAFDNAFGSSFIPTHRGMYSNAVSGNAPSDWAWRDMESYFGEAEVACLVYPRKLYIQMGDKDELFDYHKTQNEYDRLIAGFSEQDQAWVRLEIFNGNHEFIKQNNSVVDMVSFLFLN